MLRICVLLLLVVAVCSGCAVTRVAEVGDKAPDFELPGVNTTSLLDLASGDTRPVILNFWSTSCGACLKELPELNRIHEGGSAVVIGIALDEDAGRVRKVIQDKQIKFEVVLGTQQLFEQYDGYGIPYTLILDGNRIIRKRYRGRATRTEILEVIQQIEQLDGVVAAR